MSQIVPTITAYTPEEYESQLNTTVAFAERIHIDISDGDFAPSQTINLNQVYWERTEILKQIDLHLMVRRPIEWLDQIVSLSPDLVILHSESDDAQKLLPKIFEHLHRFGIKVGVALLLATDPLDIKKIIEMADHILVFGGDLGYQGGTADLSMLDKFRTLQQINPDAEIAWDGGANELNVVRISESGADVINVGSAISKKPDPRENYRILNDLVCNEE